MSYSEPQVVVVGGGPTGLLTALGLARQGIDVLVLEANEGINRSPRALTYMPPVLEVLDEFGVLDAARAVAHQCGRVEWAFADTGTVHEVDVAVLKDDVRFPFNLHMGQDTLADVILAALEQQPTARVRWNAPVTGLTQDSNGVALTIGENGETVRAAWVVGADGARSAVRQLLGIAFEGFTWPDRYVATNVEHDFTAHGIGDARFVLDPENWALICRIDKGPLWRVTYGEPADLPEETTLERARERLRHWAGGDEVTIVHASPYRVHERSADRYREGRVLLAGDAAHIVNPLGGQGLTAGILDAGMLVHALSGVIAGTFSDAALDHYARERRKMVTERSMGMSKNTKRLVQEADPEQRRADEAMLAQARDPAVMRQRMLGMMAIAGERYAPPHAA
jgi:2-polyprenyl-6-methoxyphenol hydroxylase-like FAD-dependent oxidoreductase